MRFRVAAIVGVIFLVAATGAFLYLFQRCLYKKSREESSSSRL
jgi:hypothetical protein